MIYVCVCVCVCISANHVNKVHCIKKSVEVIEYDLDQSSLQLALITSQLGVFDSDPLFHLR